MSWTWLTRRVTVDHIVIEQSCPYDELWERVNNVKSWYDASPECRTLLTESYRRVSTLFPYRQKDWFVLAHVMAMALACGEEE